MPKNQASLTAFFGNTKAQAKVPTDRLKAKVVVAAVIRKDNVENVDDVIVPSKRKSNDATASAKRKRRVIQDDSSASETETEVRLAAALPDEVKTTALQSAEASKLNSRSAPRKINDSKRSKKAADSSLPSEPDTKARGTSESTPKLHAATLPTEPASDLPPTAVSGLFRSSHKNPFASDATILKDRSETWPDQTSVPYRVLCHAFEQIEAITGRLDIQQIMTILFRQILLSRPLDLYPILYLASNSVAPAYECVELGIGDALLIKAIGQATGAAPHVIKQKYEQQGDLGAVAQTYKSKQTTLGGFFAGANKATASVAAPVQPATGWTAQQVLDMFRQLANLKGNQSQKLKVDLIQKLLVKAVDPIEVKYMIRGLQGKLRIGLAQSTVLIALAHALALSPPKTISCGDEKKDPVTYTDEVKQYLDQSLTVEKRLEGAVAIVKKAYSEVPSYDAILDAALRVPLFDLPVACTLTPGIPVAPMLAKPTKSIQEVLKRLDGLDFTVEYKYDGERAQVHLLPDGTTKVFSRNLLDTSEKYPEVPVFVQEACKNVTSFVLDAEVVAFNQKTGQLVPFQILSTRKKTEESFESAKVKVIVQAFDLMFLNGESLLNRTLGERRHLMHEHFVAVDGKFQFAMHLDHKENGDTAIIEDFLEAAVKGQCEGLMVKTLHVNANYEPSRRSLNWLKLKKDYLEGLGDSVDLVPLGAYHGKGKRTGVYGAYLLACYDTDTEEFQSVCKIGTGFSEEDLKNLADSLNKNIIPVKSSQYNVSDQLECDIWFDAVQVWEVKAADLSKSSAHRGAEGKTGEPGRGIGLRFPRFERLRDDKRPDQATSSDQILEMFYAQDTIIGGGGGVDVSDDDGI